MNKWHTEGFWSSETILHSTVVMDTCHYAFVTSHGMCTTKSELSQKPWTLGDSDVSAYVLQLTSNQCPTLVGLVIMGEAVHEWGGEHLGSLCTFCSVLQ